MLQRLAALGMGPLAGVPLSQRPPQATYAQPTATTTATSSAPLGLGKPLGSGLVYAGGSDTIPPPPRGYLGGFGGAGAGAAGGATRAADAFGADAGAHASGGAGGSGSSWLSPGGGPSASHSAAAAPTSTPLPPLTSTEERRHSSGGEGAEAGVRTVPPKPPGDVGHYPASFHEVGGA